MDPLYRPHGVESRWQRTWEEEGLYNAEASDPRTTFVICVPPPNVTDRLHMGHALNGTCQDVLIRWQRMRDFATLWQPGYDHAGIALQAVMVRRLAAEGITLASERALSSVWRACSISPCASSTIPSSTRPATPPRLSPICARVASDAS